MRFACIHCWFSYFFSPNFKSRFSDLCALYVIHSSGIKMNAKQICRKINKMTRRAYHIIFQQQRINEKYYMLVLSSPRNRSGLCLRIFNCSLPFYERFFTTTNETFGDSGMQTHPYTTHKQQTHDKSVACASSQHIHINNSAFDEWWSTHNGGMCITCTRAWHGQSAPTINISRNNNTTNDEEE